MNLFGTKSGRDMKELSPIIAKVSEKTGVISKLSNDELRHKTIDFKSKINIVVEDFEHKINQLRDNVKKHNKREKQEEIYKEIDELNNDKHLAISKKLDELSIEAFAVIKETAKRFNNEQFISVTATDQDVVLSESVDYVSINNHQAQWSSSWQSGGVVKKWDMIHYDVQLIGGLVLHQGKIAEMQTGEGKTLVSTLPIYLNALTGLGVHVVTVNDYLAKRDSEWMGPLFQFHGLTVDCIDKHEPNSEARRNAYRCDITYGTNNEFGFDYLRDNMAHNSRNLVQRSHNFAIIDEVDSVLIDDARTPLIISGPVARDTKQEFKSLKPTIDNLVKQQRNLVNSELLAAKHEISNNNEKEGGVKLFRAYRGLPKTKSLIKFLSEDGIKSLLQKTENFYMQEQSKNMHIIDDELFFTIEEKNKSIELTDKGLELLSSFSGDPDFLFYQILVSHYQKQLMCLRRKI